MYKTFFLHINLLFLVFDIDDVICCVISHWAVAPSLNRPILTQVSY